MNIENPLINGKQYSWSSIRFNFLGTPVSTVTEIKYEEMDEIKDVRAVGSKKMGYTQDNTTVTGSIKVLAKTMELIQRSLPTGKRIQDITPFDITVSYVDDSGILVSHVLEGCKLTKNSREATTGNADALEVESPLFITNINWAA